MDDISQEFESSKVLLPMLKPYEVYLFNLYIFFSLLILLCFISVIIPDDFMDSLDIIYPQKYWFIAVPTHILTTLLFLTICVKGFELINDKLSINKKNNNNENINNDYLEEQKIKENLELTEEEMMKEINYSPEEGILPDAGDINFDIVQKIIDMDIEEENENEEDMNKYKELYGNKENNEIT